MTDRPAASSSSADSLTAQDYINAQLALESEARDALPYSFDTCTRPMGRLRQPVYSCKTCAPASTAPSFGRTLPTGAAALCYSCSISCHGDHELVEIFEKRDVACDCGTERIKGVRCALTKVADEAAERGQEYGQNFWGRFCMCEVEYQPEREKGTMYQCLLGDVCGEDWFHDTCVVGLGPLEYHKKEEVKMAEGGKEEREGDEDDDPPPPPGFPTDDEFEYFICWRCVDANPWLKRYAGTPGFLPGVPHEPVTATAGAPAPTATESSATTTAPSHKRKLDASDAEPAAKRAKTPDPATISAAPPPKPCTAPPPKLCTAPPPTPSSSPSISLFLTADFRPHLCRCATCFPPLSRHRCLLEEEEAYSPPADEDAGTETGSVYDAGEKALQEIDRVQALRGVMAYNLLKEKVKGFLRPFAESGAVVGEEDVRGYFEGLREK